MTSCSFGRCNVLCSSFRIRIIVSFTFVLFLSALPIGMSDSIFHRCSDDNYTSGGEYEKNLNAILENLVNNVSRIGFNTSSYGQNPNTIYGLIQCRLDISREDCGNCSQEAHENIRQKCPKSVGAFVWFDNCYLRYDNQNLGSNPDTSVLEAFWRVQNVTNLPAFDEARRTLMVNLQFGASIPANKSFATGQTIDDSYRTIYGMVYCLRDLSNENCQTCLSNGISYIPVCCNNTPSAHILLGSCSIQFDTSMIYSSSGPYEDEVIPSAEPIPTPSPPTNDGSSKKSPSRLPIIFGVVGALLLGLSVICFIIRRKTAATFSKAVIWWRNYDAPDDRSGELPTQDQMVFDFNTLIVATENFHSHNKLGEGGFGPVYKGRLSDGREIAVKKLSVKSGQGKKEFLNEVELVARIQHRNLVKLLGCCAQGPEKLLVYEYMPNRSLDTILFDRERSGSLGWEKRYNIILGIARGMLYLHEDSQVRIIHRDIKASNILLDEQFNPKISDFGMARLFPDDQSKLNTRIAGTYGYMAPEYAMRGELSVKADIFSFGVLLLEIISGRRNSDFSLPPDMQILLPWIWRLYETGHPLDAIDSALGGLCSGEQILRCIHVGLSCTQADARMRPPMSSIILMLASNSVTLPDPTMPGFVNTTHRHASSYSDSSSGHENQRGGLLSTSAVSSTSSPSPVVCSSKNDVSITELEAR